MTVSLDHDYFTQNTTCLSFQMNSNGVKLIFLRDFSRLETCKKAIFIFSILIMGLFFVSLFSHKMIGVEMFHCFHIIFLVHLKNYNYTEIYSLIRMFTLTAFDFLQVENNFSSFQSQNIEFNTKNQELTLYSIVGNSSLFALIFIAIKLFCVT